MLRAMCAVGLLAACLCDRWIADINQHAGTCITAGTEAAPSAKGNAQGPATHILSLNRYALAWLVFALAFPAMSMGFMRSVVSKHNNYLNGALLVFYTAVNLLTAALFVPIGSSTGILLAWSALVACSLIYTLASMNFALHLES